MLNSIKNTVSHSKCLDGRPVNFVRKGNWQEEREAIIDLAGGNGLCGLSQGKRIKWAFSGENGLRGLSNSVP